MRPLCTLLIAGFAATASGCAAGPLVGTSASLQGTEYVFALSALTRAPVLANRDRYACLVQTYYPRALGLYGSRGTPIVRLTVEPSGRVFDASIQKTSGFTSLDQAALQVARGLQFIPGRIRRGAVWTEFAI